jgi:rhodanese-related sulfurtransferase
MTIQQITPDIAKAILDEDPEAIYVDVRSIPEFMRGHAPRAVNIPFLHMNEQTQQMVPNPDFSKVAEAVLPKDKKLVVGCMMGGRSQKACLALEQMGFQNLHNIVGGFGGIRDPMSGQISQPGWSQLGYPISQENGEGVGYEWLLANVK